MSSGPASPAESIKPPESQRVRSTIDFPYNDQDDAVDVAAAVHSVGGTACEWNQLAAQMKQAPSGGGFRLRLMAARTFGLLTYQDRTVNLTDLGIRIVDQKFARAARVESFLHVGLFKAMFERLNGSMLPPVAAIERTMEGLGVAPKQKDKARQVFIRSAKQAGFFEIDQNRLTLPPNIAQGPAAPPAQDSEPLESKSGSRKGGGGGGDDLHPFITGLLEKLPEPDEVWPVSARAKWLQTASNIFDLMYKAPDDEIKFVEVSVKDL